jgi:hypothetical protein
MHYSLLVNIFPQKTLLKKQQMAAYPISQEFPAGLRNVSLIKKMVALIVFKRIWQIKNVLVLRS